MSGARAATGRGLEWLEPEGEDHDIVLSTRVRLARNLQGYPFAVRARTEDREEVLDRVGEALEEGDVLEEPEVLRMDDLKPPEREILVERHLASRELAGGDAPRQGAALATGARGTLGMMINEEDHLRLQTLRNGLQLDEAWAEVDTLDTRIGDRLPYAFHHDFGFLTSCPTNVGTGLRASVLVHLPGLVLTREIRKVLEGISQVGLTYRGLYGEGSEVVGNFFQISNQTTLGKSEDDLVDHLRQIAGQVIHYEKQARSVLLKEASSVLEDKVGRAYGILRHARRLPLDELMNLLSGVRLGVSLKLLPTPRVETLNRIMIFAQQAHLEQAAGRSLDEADANRYRASRVREALEADEEDASGGDADRPGASDGDPT